MIAMKKFIPWVLGLGVTAIVSFAYWAGPPVMHRLELLFQNAHFQWRGPVAAGPEVVIAAIDEKSIDELGRWPWSRKILAELVEKLVQHEVKVIGFDMVFSSPDESSGRNDLKTVKEEIKAEIKDEALVDRVLDPLIARADNDARFAAALNKSKRAILGYFFHFERQGLEHLSDAIRHEHLENIKPTQFNGFIKSHRNLDMSAMDFKEGYAVESNVSVLSENARSAGFITFDVEWDGTLRKLPIVVKYHDAPTKRDYFFPPLSIRLLEKYLRGSLLFKVGEFGAEKVIMQGNDPFEIPVNEKGEILVNFLGGKGAFPHVSVTDILHDRGDLVPHGSLKDKIVIVGATATALGDIRVTPFDPVYPGVEIQATIIDNILHQKLLSQPIWVSEFSIGYLILMGIVLTLIYSRIKPVLGVVTCLMVGGAQFFFSHWVFVNEGFWVTDAFPFFENILIFSSLTIYWYVTENKERHFIQNVFGKYMSPKVVDKLLEDPAQLKLGGEQKELTSFFTDLAGFTTFSEKLSAVELVNLLNDYLTEMTEILLEREGTLDKYDGDAIKAFFGAPVYFGDHAKRACYVAIEMQEKLAVLRDQWVKEGKPELHMRIGINTGQMVVGNMGSQNRMNYGMNGDSVNLAARLEGANKQYGTFTMISEATYEQAKDFIEVRELDQILVVGRTTPVTIYELLGKKGAGDASILAILDKYNKGLEYYKDAQWDEAVACFENVLKTRPEDGPASTLLERCKLLKTSGPAKKEDWNGVFSLSSK